MNEKQNHDEMQPRNHETAKKIFLGDEESFVFFVFSWLPFGE
jgi:hypothetical protein